MQPALDAFLVRRTPLVEETTVWRVRGQPLPLRVAGYLGEELPPLEYVTSVQSVEFREGNVLVVRNLDEVHVLPGGQRARGETLLDALKREILEEPGWTLDVTDTLGFIHLRHLGPKPPSFPYLYPGFAQVVFLSEAVEHLPESVLPDVLEIEVAFRTVSEARGLDLILAGRLFLDAATRLRAGR